MSMRPGTSLKGWQFFNDDEKAEASYMFKDQVLDIWLEVTEERMQFILHFLQDHCCKIIKTIRHY